MNIAVSRTTLAGHIQVPGSKSHTIRALLLASLAEGISHIYNPLPSADCLSTGHAVPLIGAQVDFGTSESPVWTVIGAGQNAHLPSDIINVGDSGSLLYFMTPIAATFPGWSIFTGDDSIRRRPVSHLIDALIQLGAEAHIARPDQDAPPIIIKGPFLPGKKITTTGQLSQYISGIMMAATRLNGTTCIELTDPKEVPYLAMTKNWLISLGVSVSMSEDFKHIAVTGPAHLQGFDTTIPSDWEAVAFPLIAALLSNSKICIDNIDCTGTQGDQAIVDVLSSVGADIVWDRDTAQLVVNSNTVQTRLSAEHMPNNTLHINLSGYPDAICALACAACFIEGTTILEDIAVCRRKETDRIEVLKQELGKLGAKIETGSDYMIIHGHAPFLADGKINPEFHLHGGTVKSHNDHRIAMALACIGLALPEKSNELFICDAECCSVSFPDFFHVMNNIGAHFREI